MVKLFSTSLALCTAVLTIFYMRGTWLRNTDDPIMDGVDAPRALKEQAALYKDEVILKVIDGVWVAIGFALGNSIMVEGEDGLLIIDTTENATSASRILANFRNITTKPITHIVYTHHHADHCKGALSFIEDPTRPPEIISHELWETELHKYDQLGRHILQLSAKQFGVDLNNNAAIGGGAGTKLKMSRALTPELPPTIKIKGDFEERMINGLRTQFIHMPGETNDHLAVFLPDRGVFFSGDNIYNAFPNLYTIRGSPPRDVQVWGDSVRRILDYKPKYVVPSHTFPIVGVENITRTLKRYSNAIQLIHDQTVRFINQGLLPDEMANRVRLPEHLKNDPYLGQYYGMVPWSVKGVYTQYVGWFNGNPVELFPLMPKERAQRMVKMIGAQQLQRNAEQAFQAGDNQWALELVSFLFTLDRNNQAAKLLRRDIFRALAADQISVNARYFYLESALDDDNRVDDNIKNLSKFIMATPVDKILTSMKTLLKAEIVDGIRADVVMNFTDIKETYLLQLEDSVLRVIRCNEQPKNTYLSLTCTSVVLKTIVAKLISPRAAYAKGELQIDGGLMKFLTFMSYFDSN